MSLQTGESSHRRLVRGVFLIALAALVAIAAGCASAEHTKEYAGGGAAAGAGIGMGASSICGPLAIVCFVPFVAAGAVVGGVGGATVGAIQDAADTAEAAHAATPSDAATAAFDCSPKRPQPKGVKFVTWLPKSDYSPSGSLLIDEDPFRDCDSQIVYGTLVVNLDQPLGDSTRSIQEDIVVHCATGEVEFSWRASYDKPNASGKVVTSQPSSKAIAPGPELDAVKRGFCGSSSNA